MFHLTREFLTFTNIIIIRFSLLCLNFSLLVWISHFSCADTRISHFLLLRNFTNFSLLVWISHFSSVDAARISHFYVWISHFSVNFSLFQPATLPRRPSQWHGEYHVIDGRARAGQSGARRPITTRHTKSEKFRVPACKKWEIQTKSEKFKPKSEKFARRRRKVRNSNHKVRNSRVRAGKVRNSNQKWEPK